MQAYIEAVVERTQLLDRCTFHLGVEVRALVATDEGWEVKTSDSEEGFDYCVVATGMYHTPYVPDAFKPFRPVHSSDVVDASGCRDRNVIVVGAGKSAIDCAVAAQRHARSVTVPRASCTGPCLARFWGLYPSNGARTRASAISFFRCTGAPHAPCARGTAASRASNGSYGGF